MFSFQLRYPGGVEWLPGTQRCDSTLFLSWPLTQMQAQCSSELLLSRKRKRDGSTRETEEGERTGKIPRCTVVSQLAQSSRVARLCTCPGRSISNFWCRD